MRRLNRARYVWDIIRAKLPHNAIYTAKYFGDVERTAGPAAPVMARSIVNHFSPKTIIDVGCGTGILLEAFRNHGVRGIGLEYAESALSYCRQRNLEVAKFNLEKPHNPPYRNERFNLATSFEVAEHLPRSCASRFVKLLCLYSDSIIMTAAPPGQGGNDHVNEQPQSYWIDLFLQQCYRHDKGASARLADEWQAAGIASWYHQNVMVFRRS